MSLLELKNINNGYGNKPVLYDINLNVDQGEIVSIIGPNGSGKSTILKSISGLLPSWSGSILFDTDDITASKASEMVKRGIAFSPQGNRVFDELSLLENLEVGGFILKTKELKKRIDEVLDFFPQLRPKTKMLAGELSGGEQQMLSVARSLMTSPKLLMLDEPSLGLQPNLLKDVFENLTKINSEFGISILIVEQKVTEVLSISNRTYGLKLGRIAYEGPSNQLLNDKEKLKKLFL